MKYTDDKITYNNVTAPGMQLGSKITRSGYTVDGSPLNPNANVEDTGGVVVNVLNIDWCGAEVNGEVFNTSSDVLSKIAEHDKRINDLSPNSSIVTPADIVMYFADDDTVPAELNYDVTIKKTNSASFAINDDSHPNKFTVNRTDTPKYSLLAWPKTFGTFAIPSGWKSTLYDTKYNGVEYYGIISTNKNKAFMPIVVNR